MQQILNTAGSIGACEPSWDDDSLTATPRNFGSEKAVISKANDAPLVALFKYYNIKCDEYNKKIKCPFKNHLGGNESTPSFYFYPKDNNFWCFGCKIGIKPVDFVMEMEEIERFEAAQKIVSLFENDIESSSCEPEENRQDRLKIMMEFSNFIRDTLSISNANHIKKVEEICKIYDNMNSKHNLKAEALQSITNRLILKIKELK